MTPPTKQNIVCKFIYLVKYFCIIWAWKSHTLDSLTILTSSKVKFNWTVVEQGFQRD